jgi:uncharacterized protein DUF6894
MPLYFFHLNFGDRFMPDEEGVELPNRSAAREEALAVVRELADPELAGNPRRWASWFLQVADDRGEFLRVPIGHPALEIVTGGQERHTEDPEVKRSGRAARVAIRQNATAGRRSPNSVQEISAAGERTAQLVERDRQLRGQLSFLFLVIENVLVRTRHAVSYARLVDSTKEDTDAWRTANKPVRRACPHLVLLQGG